MLCKKNGGVIAIIIAIFVAISVANDSNAEPGSHSLPNGIAAALQQHP